MLPLQHPPQFKPPSLGVLPRLASAPRASHPLLNLPPSLPPPPPPPPSRAHHPAPSSSSSSSSSSSPSSPTSLTSLNSIRKEASARITVACLYCKNAKIKCSGSIDGGSCVGCANKGRHCAFAPPETRDLKGLRRVVEACLACRKSKVRCEGAVDGGACRNCSHHKPLPRVCVFSTQPTRDRAANSRRKRAKLIEEAAAKGETFPPPPIPETSSTQSNPTSTSTSSIPVIPQISPPTQAPSVAPTSSSAFSNLVVRPRNFVGSVWFFFTRSSGTSTSSPSTDLTSGGIGDGAGMMMLASYSESPYGAYDEIVWSPGSFDVSDVSLSKEALSAARPTHVFSSSLDAIKENRWGASASLGRFNFTPFDGSTLISVFSTSTASSSSSSATPKLVFEALTTPCSLSVLLSPISSLLRTEGSRIWKGFGAEIVAGTMQACWVEQRSVSGSVAKKGESGEEKVEGKELWCLGCAVEEGTLRWGDSRTR